MGSTSLVMTSQDLHRLDMHYITTTIAKPYQGASFVHAASMAYRLLSRVSLCIAQISSRLHGYPPGTYIYVPRSQAKAWTPEPGPQSFRSSGKRVVLSRVDH